MISQRLTTVDTEDPNAEVDAATWVVEQFTVEGDQASVQSRIHRTLTESQVAWPGQPADMWRRWVLESCQSLGMQCRSINCAHKQIYDLVREGGRLIIRLPETGDWIGVSATGAGIVGTVGAGIGGVVVSSLSRSSNRVSGSRVVGGPVTLELSLALGVSGVRGISVTRGGAVSISG